MDLSSINKCHMSHLQQNRAANSNGASGGSCIPLVTPSTLLLSSRGRVKLYQNPVLLRCGPPVHLTNYLAPEYRPHKQCTDTETEKMWIYGLGETLKRAALTSHAATSRLSGELCQVLTDMTKPQASVRASLMNLLDVISEYCKKKQQSRPFSHIVMDLHQETMADLEMVLESSWGLPVMPEIKTRNRNDINLDTVTSLNLPKPWPSLCKSNNLNTKSKLTREASTSMEHLSASAKSLFTPGTVLRPKSMCIPTDSMNRNQTDNLYLKLFHEQDIDDLNYTQLPMHSNVDEKVLTPPLNAGKRPGLSRVSNIEHNFNVNKRRGKVRRNPVQRAASRLYKANDVSKDSLTSSNERECVGPEFVVRAGLPSKLLVLPDCKGNVRKNVTVILLNGQKLDITCNPNTTTAGQLFELIIQKEHIEENFMLGLSALIAGDFVFLPSDARICKAIGQGVSQSGLTLFVRVRFFLPNLRTIRSAPSRHLLYLQLRRSILEYQLPCTYSQLIDFGGLALQAEFGDFIEKEHGARDYFLLEHYVPETVSCNVDECKRLKQELIVAHITRRGLEVEKAEESFMLLAQTLPHYGGHFYTATWVLKDSSQKDVWLYISAQGINLYERNTASHQWNLILLEMFEWITIQTLCYSKHYLCILPHTTRAHELKLKKYKLKMDHKKSYFTFRLASLHHQFFLRLRTQYASLQSLSEQFGVQLKDMKNETNSLYKLEALTNPLYALDSATVNAETEFKIEFCSSSKSSLRHNSDCKYKRSKSISDFGAVNDYLMIEEFQNKENENPQHGRIEYNSYNSGLILDSNYLSGLPNSSVWDKRRGVKMGVSAFQNTGQRVSRSMEAVNALLNEELEQLSLQSTSLHCSSTSVSRSLVVEYGEVRDAYILDSSIKSNGNQFLPDFQETLSESLIEKLNKFSFAEECTLYSVSIERDLNGSLGLQIMEGSDGKVYIQSVIPGGPAHLQGNIHIGDQIVAVNGRNLLSMKYIDALELLKISGKKVEFVLSHVTVSKNSIHHQPTLPLAELKLKNEMKYKMNLANINESHAKVMNISNKLKRMSYPNAILNNFQDEHLNIGNNLVEKYVTESCHDITNPHKLKSDVPYHKHIRYDLEEAKSGGHTNLNKTMSKSCTHIFDRNSNNDRAIIVDMIPKVKSCLESKEDKDCSKRSIPAIPLPRSLGLSRKWRGPVRYPVTPIKKSQTTQDDSSNYGTASDEEQIFI
ncbi:hypothetical protein RN001_004577 [Aquatica leii]|uniref:Tyrosine-protein phosphatase non-receptor type 13 n=1 Tax=Aquatica leii TaxID=1421715 RepID=A0AAN7PBT2_9COLE|nr:hypothetical protein RN001_004577 [Aquatica leii]